MLRVIDHFYLFFFFFNENSLQEVNHLQTVKWLVVHAYVHVCRPPLACTDLLCTHASTDLFFFSFSNLHSAHFSSTSVVFLTGLELGHGGRKLVGSSGPLLVHVGLWCRAAVCRSLQRRVPTGATVKRRGLTSPPHFSLSFCLFDKWARSPLRCFMRWRRRRAPATASSAV